MPTSTNKIDRTNNRKLATNGGGKITASLTYNEAVTVLAERFYAMRFTVFVISKIKSAGIGNDTLAKLNARYDADMTYARDYTGLVLRHTNSAVVQEMLRDAKDMGETLAALQAMFGNIIIRGA